MICCSSQARPGRDGAPAIGASLTELEHKQAWDGYMRRGDTMELRSLELKLLSRQSDPDGGYLVPTETEAEIARIMSEASPIRAIADVRQVSGASLKKPIATTGAQAGWVGEADTRPETSAPGPVGSRVPHHGALRHARRHQSLLDDSAVNIEEWLASEVQIAFAEQEGSAFVTGDGIRKPRGFSPMTALPTTPGPGQARLSALRCRWRVPCLQPAGRAG